MKSAVSLLSLALCACGTAEIRTPTLEQDIDTEDGSTSENSEEETTNETNTENSESGDEPSNQPEGNDGSDNTPNDSGSSNGQTGGSSTYTLNSTTWYPVNAAMIEDNCDWDSLLRQFFGIGADFLLPESFTVNGFDGYFEIEANSYGARGPISCEFEGAEFECEAQSVTPLAFDLGTFGWTYTIDFTGFATSETSLYGVAEVRFPTVSDWLVPIFQSMGSDHTQCVQSFELELSPN